MSQTLTYPAVTRALPNIPIRDVLAHKPNQLWSVEPESTVYTAIELMANAHIGAVLVLRGRSVAGILTERDYARKVILMGRSSHATTVEQIMSREVITVEPSVSLQSCMQLMTEHRFRHLPVVAAGSPLGMVSIGDLVREILRQQLHAIDELHRYVTGEPRLTPAAITEPQ